MAIQIARAPHPLLPSHQSLELPDHTHDTPRSSPTLTRVAVLTPGHGENVTVGQPVLIRWQTSCVPGLLLYRLQLSTDGGITYCRDIAPLLDGQECRYLWTPTDDLVTPAARLRVIAIHWGEATSNDSFAILPRARIHGALAVSALV